MMVLQYSINNPTYGYYNSQPTQQQSSGSGSGSGSSGPMPQFQAQLGGQTVGYTPGMFSGGVPNQQPQYGGNQTFGPQQTYQQPSGPTYYPLGGSAPPPQQGGSPSNGIGGAQLGGSQTYTEQPVYTPRKNPGQTAPPPSQNGPTMGPINQSPQNGSGGQNIGMNPGSSAPSYWMPQQQQQQAATWQPQQQQQQVQRPVSSMMPQATQAAPQQSLLQQGLSTGRGNAQTVQNMALALNQVGAGSNNTFDNQGTARAATAGPLLGNIAQSNGNNGSVQYAGGFNGGQNAVSYNMGLGANYSGQSATQRGAAPANYYGTTAPSSSTTNGWAPNIQSGYGTGDEATNYSDERLKTDINPGANRLQSFLDGIGAHEYRYKDQADGEGQFVSPMAQELEKTELGKSAVVETPRGKMVNYGRLMGVELAALAMINSRLNRLEKKRN